MGNPDLIIIFNKGEKVFSIKGIEYDNRKDAIQFAITRYEKWSKDIFKLADKPEELDFTIRSIEIYEIY